MRRVTQCGGPRGHGSRAGEEERKEVVQYTIASGNVGKAVEGKKA